MRGAMKEFVMMRVLGLGCALLLCCHKLPPPAPTVASLEPGRAGVVAVRQGQAREVVRQQRIEDGTEVRTPAEARASLFLDSGAWVLLDRDSAAVFRSGGLDVLRGRLFLDARGGDPVQVALPGEQVKLTTQNAGLSVALAGKDAQVYCSAGQVTWQAPGGGGRLESGLSLVYKDGQAKETAQALFDDWTQGLLEPGPLRPLLPAGVGQLSARSAGDIGGARTPLIIRRHEVRVRIMADLAETEVEQTFFNPRSESLTGVYTVRLPESAVLQEFAVGDEDSGVSAAQVVARSRGGQSLPESAAQLEWAGAGQYRGVINDIRPGKTRVVRLRYSEWLPHYAHSGGPRRSYVYPMGQSAAAQAGEVPNLGEFALEVDLSAAQAGGLEAGMGARVEDGKVILRRSDFRPRADFVLELLDPEEHKPGELVAFRGDREEDGSRYLLVQPVPQMGAQRPGIDLVLVLDVSAGTDEARLDLGRSAAQALLRQLSPQDRVGVLAASLSAVSLGREALGPATPARVEELSDAIGKQVPGGATDLSAALRKAVSLLPPGQGTVIYLGDGRPTVGALLPGELRAELMRLGPLPRMYAVAVGSDANVELLQALCDTSANSLSRESVLRIEDRPEAARAALHLLTRAAQPALTAVTAALGEDADVIYPEGPVTLEGGGPLQIVARLRRDRSERPRKLVLSGIRDGLPFTEEYSLSLRDVSDHRDLSRRWAQARLAGLLARGAGKEAATDIGTRYAVITPWTALLLGGSAGAGYAQVMGEEERGTFVPPALRGQAPQDASIALWGGVSTRPVRTVSIDELYTQALSEKQAPARVCYDRKAAGHPELSGRVSLRVKVALDGTVTQAKIVSTTLRASDVEECISRAIAGLRLPAAPDGKPHEVDFAMQLEQEAGGGTHSCSAASRAYLSSRRALWRERLSRNPGPQGAISAWRDAEARCELRTWIDRRALLDLMRAGVGRTVEQVDLYHRFDGDAQQEEVQEYLRREILRAVRTEEDVRAAQAGLELSGGIDETLLAQQLGKARTLRQQIAVVRQFLQLSPRAIALKVRLLSLLEADGQKQEARKLCDSLRADPGADAAVRQAIGEYLLRSGEGAEGARAFSEIVEFAPFDPWGRRRLGDLYRAHGLYDAAYREYQVLGWLLPQDDTVFLLLADAAAGAGRSDEALRLLARVAEAVGAHPDKDGPSAWARALHAVQLARLRDEAQARGDRNLLGQLSARGRSDGLSGYAGRLLFALTYAHPDAGLELYVTPPGSGRPAGKGEMPGERAAIQGGAVGIEAQRYDRIEPGEWLLTVRRPEARSGTYEGELLVLLDEDRPGEVIRRTKVQLGERSEQRFAFSNGQLVRR